MSEVKIIKAWIHAVTVSKNSEELCCVNVFNCV